MIGQNLIKLPEVDSTNNYARGLMKAESTVEGTAVLAYYQTVGRGQEGNSWESEPGMNLTVSYILTPEPLKPEKQFYLSMIAALSARDFIESIYPGAEIKWPNDIYISNRKIGGILIENSFLGNCFDFTVMGFGLNINQKEFHSDAPNPVSLNQLTGIIYNIDECYLTLSEMLDGWYSELKKENFGRIRNNYLSSLYRMNQWAAYRMEGNKITGKIIDVDDTGRLKVAEKNGKIYSFGFKEVEFIV